MRIEFTVYGKPQGKERPRVTTRGGFARAYTPKRTREYEISVREAYSCIAKGYGFASAPLKVEIFAYYPMPQSASKAKKHMMLDGIHRPMVKPDADNVAKAILDSLNGIAYTDDSQIVDLRVIKHYDTLPRVEVTISDML